MTDLIGPRASRDRIRRVASMAAHGRAAGQLGSDDSILGSPCLRSGNPIWTLVRCEKQLFLAIGSVNGLTLGSESFDELSIDLLPDTTSQVSFQILRLVRANVAEAQTKQHDWSWNREMEGRRLSSPGRLVFPLNPDLSTSTPGQPTYLFESSQLMVIAVSLHDRITPQDRRNISGVEQSPYFPYRDECYVYQGEACFLCEDDVNERLIEPEGEAACTKCQPATHLDLGQGQRVLEHCAAHILHDPSCHRTHQPCGLCLRPYPQSRFFLRKGQGAGSSPQIDWTKSTCARKVNFQYGPAATSKAKSPSSNVPIICAQCGPKAPAVWKYNLREHWLTFHSLAEETVPLAAGISTEEIKALKNIWKKRHNQPKHRDLGKNKEPLVISEKHSSRLAFR
ncbi:hypothetical protein C8J57DRAFT_1099583 [Mycena rebaudengoi]|nr:hypothetical protein C8J57DRAFT_1099583 [Mycena rebaudengoi]